TGSSAVSGILPRPDRRRFACIGSSPGQHDGGVGHPLSFHQVPECCGILARWPNAAVRHRTAETPLLVGAMNSVAILSEEDRIRHRRIVPFLAEVVDLHTKWPEGAARRFVATPAG